MQYIFLCEFADGSWCQHILASDATAARQQFLAANGMVDTGQVVTVQQQTFE